MRGNSERHEENVQMTLRLTSFTSQEMQIYVGCVGTLEFEVDLGSKLDMILRMESFLSACGMALIR